MLAIKENSLLNLDTPTAACRNVRVAAGTTIWDYVHLSECSIGAESMIGTFVEIGPGVTIGERSRIQSHATISSGVTIGPDCFIGHAVVFIQPDPNLNGQLAPQAAARIGRSVSIGSNATILPVSIGAHSVIGAGSVVTRDVPEKVVMAGNPAQIIRNLD